nr:MAG TPA: hypothetical protein [Caudoviricetes sp.]
MAYNKQHISFPCSMQSSFKRRVVVITTTLMIY